MGRMKPQRGLLAMWRIMLAVAMFVPAFLNALFLRPTVLGGSWMWMTLAWLIIFLALYLWYLPVRYHKISFSVQGDKLLLYSGALYNRVRWMPLNNIQFTALVANPIGQLFGLCSLVVTAAGGRLVLPGLRRKDAEALAAVLHDQQKD